VFSVVAAETRMSSLGAGLSQLIDAVGFIIGDVQSSDELTHQQQQQQQPC